VSAVKNPLLQNFICHGTKPFPGKGTDDASSLAFLENKLLFVYPINMK